MLLSVVSERLQKSDLGHLAWNVEMFHTQTVALCSTHKKKKSKGPHCISSLFGNIYKNGK